MGSETISVNKFKVQTTTISRSRVSPSWARSVILSAKPARMPAPQILAHSPDGIKALGHVNLMVDTLIANATIEDLRAITRNLLASGSPGLATAFTDAARTRLRQTIAKRIANANGLFETEIDGIHAVPTPSLDNILARIRSLYGAGMGFASLGLLASIVKATIGLRWEREGPMATTLAVIDTDITQAIQSCKEELEVGRANDLTTARDTVNKLWISVQDSLADVESWGGEFPFERAVNSIECWKI
ncbi:hypothetical protein PISMIDRAFT_353892 [Pisolithus microcarpus 441]|uniref:Uncharacterized protein n=1 Tax=Pisolithus microcarpus 441 TaxID=765257 RepID=A0A0C9ZZF5_9AGAM|nr:hypothetical protein BKA83DRAFT_353892 [Pisolithus microcarpus]KIK25168.1 hypothetical protein PISMIDRAFT_353892 [Pisolithus microcarpus 441]